MKKLLFTLMICAGASAFAAVSQEGLQEMLQGFAIQGRTENVRDVIELAQKRGIRLDLQRALDGKKRGDYATHKAFYGDLNKFRESSDINKKLTMLPNLLQDQQRYDKDDEMDALLEYYIEVSE